MFFSETVRKITILMCWAKYAVFIMDCKLSHCSPNNQSKQTNEHL